jgi:hypothetical protein
MMSKTEKKLESKSAKRAAPSAVCLADLPAHKMSVAPEITLEEVVKQLEADSELPGVLVVKGDELTTVLPRQKIFERLGHMYGVELFLRKPVSKLEESLQSRPFRLPGHTRIEEAVTQALGRAQESVYDPIVVEYEDQSLGLLDMYVLFMAQSEILSNLSNTVGKLEKLEGVVQSDLLSKAAKFDKALELLSQVVPYHQAAIYRKEKKKLELITGRGISIGLSADRDHLMEKNVFIHELLQKTQEPINIPDVRAVGVWQDLPGLSNPRSWLGTPIMKKDHIIGILAISRVSFSPFSKSERDISLAFANQLADLL